jgi:hypothetical protein
MLLNTDYSQGSQEKNKNSLKIFLFQALIPLFSSKRLRPFMDF